VKTALLLSGGVDSTAIAYWKRPTYGVTINYGQRPFKGELRASDAVCEALGIEHLVLEADLSSLGSGDMAGTQPLTMAPIPEWWPFRNQLLVTVAAMSCIARDVESLFIGTVASDAQHADGQPAFVHLIDELVAMQEGGLRVVAPAIAMTSIDLVEASNVPKEVLGFCHSCHTSDWACSWCRGCLKHLEVIETLKLRNAI
jgi:7-cyano-7-deazaguanine synthase